MIQKKFLRALHATVFTAPQFKNIFLRHWLRPDLVLSALDVSEVCACRSAGQPLVARFVLVHIGYSTTKSAIGDISDLYYEC